MGECILTRRGRVETPIDSFFAEVRDVNDSEEKISFGKSNGGFEVVVDDSTEIYTTYSELSNTLSINPNTIKKGNKILDVEGTLFDVEASGWYSDGLILENFVDIDEANDWYIVKEGGANVGENEFVVGADTKFILYRGDIAYNEGLTPDKIVAGNTVLGVAGTGGLKHIHISFDAVYEGLPTMVFSRYDLTTLKFENVTLPYINLLPYKFKNYDNILYSVYGQSTEFTGGIVGGHVYWMSIGQPAGAYTISDINSPYKLWTPSKRILPLPLPLSVFSTIADVYIDLYEGTM